MDRYVKAMTPGGSRSNMKQLFALGVVCAAASFGGCVAPGATGQNLNGFSVDEKCLAFWQDSPVYGGNRALAYAANCTHGGGNSR